MTIKQNILAALHGQAPGSVPWNIHHELLPRGQFEREMRDSGLGIVDKGHTAYIALTESVTVEKRSAWEDGTVNTYTTYRTPIGTLKEAKVIGPDGSSWVTGYPVKTEDDLRILEFIVRDTVYYPNHKSIAQANQDMGEDGIVLCRMLRSPLQRLLIEWMGVEGVFFAFQDCPGMLEQLLEIMSESDQSAFEITAQSPAEVVWSAENITSSITSPRLYARYCQPYYNRMAVLLHASHKLYGIHMDGQLSALAQLIAQTDVDFIEGFTPPPMGNLSLEKARSLWPEKAIWVNFPGCLLHCNKDEITAYARRLIKEGMEGGRFLLTLTEDFPNPERSLKVLGQAIRVLE